MTLTPTPEQEAILLAARTTDDSLLINALAGAAKTSTLEMITHQITNIPIICLAFNKRIAEEMTKRLPGHVKCQTLNALGHKVWATACAKRLTLNTRKSYEILKSLTSDLKGREKDESYDIFAEVLRAVSDAKMLGYIPDGLFPDAHRLLGDADFFDTLESESTALFRRLIRETLLESIKRSYLGEIDFDDQIYMPSLFGGQFPTFPLVMVDEAQDLSAINHEMLKKLAKRRLIAVGDPWQSIYGFRGAVFGGMQKLRETFSMRELTLSVSFRCPELIVRRAWFRVPHMKWRPNAPAGQISPLSQWSQRDVPDGSAIICRNNAPLFKCALSLIRSGRGVKLVGSDIGPGLIRALKKLGPEQTIQAEAFKLLAQWYTRESAKSKKLAALDDKYDCLKVFISHGRNLREAVVYAESLFKSDGPIQLMSGHKAKGLEFENVFHLDPHRIPSKYATSQEELEQEFNVRYVIETRAKSNLFLVDMDTFAA